MHRYRRDDANTVRRSAGDLFNGADRRMSRSSNDDPFGSRKQSLRRRGLKQPFLFERLAVFIKQSDHACDVGVSGFRS